MFIRLVLLFGGFHVHCSGGLSNPKLAGCPALKVSYSTKGLMLYRSNLLLLSVFCVYDRWLLDNSSLFVQAKWLSATWSLKHATNFASSLHSLCIVVSEEILVETRYFFIGTIGRLTCTMYVTLAFSRKFSSFCTSAWFLYAFLSFLFMIGYQRMTWVLEEICTDKDLHN